MSKQNQIIIAIVAVVLVALVAVFGMRQGDDTASKAMQITAAKPKRSSGPGRRKLTRVAEDDLGALETPIRWAKLCSAKPMRWSPLSNIHRSPARIAVLFTAIRLPALTEKYIDKGLVKIYFRPFPFDPYATAGAMLAHCVSPAARGSFLDILFKRQQQWIQAEQPDKRRCKPSPNRPACQKAILWCA